MKYINLNDLGTIRVIVDDDVFNLYSEYNMSYKGGYCTINHNGLRTYLHKLVLPAATGCIVDHINGDPLDNRRENLRVCSIKDNIRNSRKWKTRPLTSQYKGVGYRGDRKIWRAYICVNRKQISLGHHKTEVEAAKAYNLAAVKYFKEFASPNIIV